MLHLAANIPNVFAIFCEAKKKKKKLSFPEIRLTRKFEIKNIFWFSFDYGGEWAIFSPDQFPETRLLFGMTFLARVDR